MVKHESDFEYVRPSAIRYYSVWITPIVISIGSFALYLRTMAPSVFWGDSAAFAAANFTLGLPHSPSFPLYTLLGRLFSLVPGVAPAFLSNLMSVLFATLSVTFFYLIARLFIDVPVFQSKPKLLLQKRDSDRRDSKIQLDSTTKSVYTLIPTLGVTVLYAVSLPVWLSAVRAEVYSLQLFLTLAAVYVSFRGVRESRRRLFFLGLWLYALTYTNHPLLSLAFLPAFIYIFFLNMAAFKHRWATLATAFVFLVAAFTVYFYLPFRAAFEPAINWGRPDNLESFIAAITRSSDLSNLSAMVTSPDYLMRLKKIAFFTAGQIGWPLIGVLPVGFWGMYKGSRKLFPFLVLAVLFNLAVVLWTADFDARNYDMLNYLAPLTGLVLIISVAGLLYLLRMKIATARASIMLAVLVGGFVYIALDSNAARADLSGVNGPDEITGEILSNLPPGSILLVAEDDLLLPMWYRAYVDSNTVDISVLSPGAMVNAAYRKQLTVNYPHIIFPENFTNDKRGQPDTLAMKICRLNADERDIYIQFGVPGISHRHVYPSGILFKYIGDRKRPRLDKEIYKKHMQMADKMLAGCHKEAATAEFTGRWLFTVGAYYDRIGDATTAWKLFTRALEVDRESIGMRLKLAKALARAKRYKEALKYLADALEIDSQHPECLELGRRIIKAIETEKTVASK
jgi:hypothetical protein